MAALMDNNVPPTMEKNPPNGSESHDPRTTEIFLLI
jgi:hypothetical protein